MKKRSKHTLVNVFVIPAVVGCLTGTTFLCAETLKKSSKPLVTADELRRITNTSEFVTSKSVRNVETQFVDEAYYWAGIGHDHAKMLSSKIQLDATDLADLHYLLLRHGFTITYFDYDEKTQKVTAKLSW